MIPLVQKIEKEPCIDLRNDPIYNAAFFRRKIILHLILKKKWFNLISSGEKKEEYRDCTSYWKNRIWDRRKEIDTICFHCGYTNKIYYSDVENISIGQGKEEWGAVQGKEYYIIKLKGGDK